MASAAAAAAASAVSDAGAPPDTCAVPPPPHEEGGAAAQPQPAGQHHAVTLRAGAVGTVLGVLFSIITLRLTLGSAGLTPPLTVPGGLLSFLLLKALDRATNAVRRISSSCRSARAGGGPDGKPFAAAAASSPQETAVAQTLATAAFKITGWGGFSSYLIALSYQVYLVSGGAPRGTPGFDPDAIVEPTLGRTYAWLALVAFAGILPLLELRKLLIVVWRLPFPSGAAAGSMINSLHQADEAARVAAGGLGGSGSAALDLHPDAAGAAAPVSAQGLHGRQDAATVQPQQQQEVVAAAGPGVAARQVKVLALTTLGSLLFNAFKWLFSGPTMACGFATLPTFGAAAAAASWRFDFQQQFVGSGMLVPHVVAWSMLLGAVLSWGVMWQLIQSRYEGVWYPAGLYPSDMKGLGGYKISLSVALLLGEGAFILGKALALGIAQLHASLAQRRSSAAAQQRQRQGSLHMPGSRAAAGQPCTTGSSSSLAAFLEQPSSSCSRRHSTSRRLSSDAAEWGCAAPAAETAAAGEHAEPWPPAAEGGNSTKLRRRRRCGQGAAGTEFQETPDERRVREAVFLSDALPAWWGRAGYAILAAIGTAGIPFAYPGVPWWMVGAAFLLGPLVALINAYGAGVTDLDQSGNFSVVFMWVFAAWATAAHAGNGIVSGCIASGVLMVFSVSAAVLLQDLRTGYVTQARPRSMLVAQLLGAVLGVVFSPLAFALIWSTGQVGRPGGDYPAPFAAVTRGVVSLGVQGTSALPKHCGTLAAAHFVAALLLCALREGLPPRLGRFVPVPMALAWPYFIGPAPAIDFWLGSVIVLLWERIGGKASAAAYSPLAAAGLLVGDGLWAVPAAVLAVAGVVPPLCLKVN